MEKKVNMKYKIEIPNTFARAVKLDIKNRNTLWQTAAHTKIAALILNKCFKFKAKGFKTAKSY